MSRFDRLKVLNTILETGLVPLFYEPHLETAQKILKALYEGGARVAEFTNRGDGAMDLFAPLVEFAATSCPSLILGVGSIVESPTAALYLARGAHFVVGPGLNPEISRLCNRHKIAYLPGCGNASEISQAEELGAEIVKVFPGNAVGGPAFVKAILGPMPWSRLMPTGGVEAQKESIAEWIKAGASCIGLGSGLVRQDWVKAGKFNEISDLTRQALGWIEEARKDKKPS
jgi:2-dehydro-3-deoxyphosphogluconate aldolase/(4S)-4-hydroxy-2-oxoglutarate aldolase